MNLKANMRNLAQLKNSKTGRFLGISLGVILLILSIYYLKDTLVEIIQQLDWQEISLEPRAAVSSFLLMFCCVTLGGFTWYYVLCAFSATPKLLSCISINFLSSIGGYLPLYGAKNASKAILATRFGISTEIATLGALLEFISLVVTRLSVSLITIPSEFVTTTLSKHWTGIIILMRFLGGAILLAFPWLISLLISKMQKWLLPSREKNIAVNVRFIYISMFFMVIAYLNYGLSFYVLSSSFYGYHAFTLWTSVFSTSSSFLIGLLAFSLPGGIVVRETALVWALSGAIPQTDATILAVLIRLILILSEILGIAVGLILSRRSIHYVNNPKE